MNKKLDRYIFSDTRSDSFASDNIAIREFQLLAKEYSAVENNGNRLRIITVR